MIDKKQIKNNKTALTSELALLDFSCTITAELALLYFSSSITSSFGVEVCFEVCFVFFKNWRSNLAGAGRSGDQSQFTPHTLYMLVAPPTCITPQDEEGKDTLSSVHEDGEANKG